VDKAEYKAKFYTAKNSAQLEQETNTALNENNKILIKGVLDKLENPKNNLLVS